MRSLRFILLFIVLLAPTASLAVRPDEMLKDPALEARARSLSEELRCMVCQNQSIDDSEAPLALVAGLGGLILMARRRKTVSVHPEALSPEEQARLATLVEPAGSDR